MVTRAVVFRRITQVLFVVSTLLLSHQDYGQSSPPGLWITGVFQTPTPHDPGQLPRRLVSCCLCLLSGTQHLPRFDGFGGHKLKCSMSGATSGSAVDGEVRRRWHLLVRPCLHSLLFSRLLGNLFGSYCCRLFWYPHRFGWERGSRYALVFGPVTLFSQEGTK